jgi:hypothetical protein
MRENPEKYKIRYPSYLPWSSQQWLVAQGDVLLSDEDGTHYLVTRVYKSPVPGEKPVIYAREIESDLHDIQ